jgi:hypothetical protein
MADTFRVYRRRHLLATRQFGLSDKNPFFDYYARWFVPRTARRPLRFCVSSLDAAGNKSNVACGPITIR